MGNLVLGLDEVDRTHVAVVGGKGAHLAELARIDGVDVPAAFVVTTDAFRRVKEAVPTIDDRLDRLSRLTPDDRAGISTLSAGIREIVEEAVVPDEVAAAITTAVAELGEEAAYAVRSSAAAEDSPGASFAGQHDTYLNVVGPAAVLRHVSRCWASLFTERAVSYRLRNGFDQRAARMAVVVQRMVAPDASGVLFTADPVSGNRRVAAVEATFGLGEALVSGAVDPDVYRVRDGVVVAATVATKRRAVHADPAGGTREEEVEPARQELPALTDAQVVRLVDLGRRIEAQLGCPQDIEWCVVGDDVRIVQSRPVTTLFPVPGPDDGTNRVYISVGHQQMMTDPMKPLGLSLWLLTTRAPMTEAGGRLFVDVTRRLASPAGRAALVEGMHRSDPLIGDALQALVDRGFVPTVPDEDGAGPAPGGAPEPIETDPAVVIELIERNRASIAVLERDIRARSGPDLFDFVLADLEELQRLLFDPHSHQAIMTGMEATWWLNERLEAWLGEKNAADPLTQSVDHNVTSEMGLALLDVADVIRPHPDVVAFLEGVGDDDGFLEELAGVGGGRAARDAIQAWLDEYGVRCVGEIDVTRPRWSERPSALLATILANVRNFEPGAAARRFERGRQEALERKEELLARVRALPDGERKAEETERMIERVRTFAGYREYPKYGMIRRYFAYKQALLAEADRLVEAGVLGEREDAFFLTFPELHEAARTRRADRDLIERRKDEFRSYRALTPPRVITSEGEAVTGAYRHDERPNGALVGLGVSAGTVEGRARVVLDMAQADLEPGDILVTVHTDPSWSPLFVSIAALVTEVGGLMTHGAVIAREYGLPAVVGVEHATRRIRDGQRIRVDGTGGWVELNPPA